MAHLHARPAKGRSILKLEMNESYGVLSAQRLTDRFAHGLYFVASWAASVYKLAFWKLNIKNGEVTM